MNAYNEEQNNSKSDSSTIFDTNNNSKSNSSTIFDTNKKSTEPSNCNVENKYFGKKNTFCFVTPDYPMLLCLDIL